MPSVRSVLPENCNRRPCILLHDNKLCTSFTQRHGRQVLDNTPTMRYGVAEPKYKEFINKTERLKTFKEWLNDFYKTPDELADAGFFSEGYADCVRCFHCAGKTRGWEPNDDPWIEHARWFPRCEYVSEKKGKTFVDVVLDLSKTHEKITTQMVQDKLREMNQ